MIITCEQCQKRYLVKDEEIGAAGRRVRCVSCNNRWFQKAPDSLKEIALDPIQPDNMNADTGVREARSYTTFLFMLSLLIFITALAYLARYEVVKMWPVVAQYYEAAGISMSNAERDMKLSNIQPIHIEEGERNVLIIKGDVTNISKEVKNIPTVKIELLGPCQNQKPVAPDAQEEGHEEKNQCVLKEWQHSFAESRLLPGEKITFETEPTPTIKEATTFKVHF